MLINTQMREVNYLWNNSYYPETGYGYIEASEELSDINNTSNIKQFIEKPNKKISRKTY